MWDTIISQNVRRSNRNLLLTNAGLLVVAIIVVVLAGKYLYNVYAGPVDLQRDDLLALTDPDQPSRYYVNVTGDDVVEAEFQEIEQRLERGTNRVLEERVVADYMLLLVEDRLLLVKARPGAIGTSYTGALSALDQDEQDYIREFEGQVPDARGMFLPLLLDAQRNFGAPGYALTVALLIAVAIAIFNLIKGLRRMSDPERHPAMSSLARYGAPRDIATTIDGEVRAGSARTFGGAILTPNWLLFESKYGLQSVKLDDIVWIYKKVVRRSVYFIPVAKINSAIIVTQRSKPLTLQLKGDLVDSLLTELLQRVPWVLAGYDASLEKLWNKNRAEVLRALKERKRQMQQSQQPGWSSHQPSGAY